MNEMLQQFFHIDNFIPTAELLPMVGSLLLNSVVVWVLVHFFYYPKGHRRDYYFTFVLLSVSIFMLIYLLLGNSADMGIGAALGLFAIFGIIRYRTECVPIREMTYLFFIVALSVLNAKTGDLNFMSRIIINLIMILVVWGAENHLSAYREGCKFVKYDNIDLIQPERYEELKADLEKRLGVKITRVDVGAVDFLTDMTMLRVFYEDPDHRIKAVDRLTKIPTDNAF
ncbi:MAG: DUF4956 domain-containing protein [Bacteroidales bacterium]|nr:DUF4956 domain-containing protein [Bacteroidales bacterium]MCI7614044.1 DUF4956 domain-containing protein [Bacteroidales bacterium]MDD6594393.1 DUF4956 domain-containing protein [Bacteroidales bacterium]MDY4460060.1 DUF4956 domain-containing protein [Alloprevotella sp.]MDY4874376.1 DUF4956 domain-containing protein [Alloprevotella sp.]